MRAMSRFIVPFRMHNTGWFLLIVCVALGFQIGGLLLALPIGALLIASLLLHEVGHMLAATALRVPVREFGLRLGGAYNRRAYATRRRDELIISAAGPLMNLFLVVPLLFVPRLGGQLALCVVNLLPLPSSDGLRILRTLWSFTSPRVMVPGLGQNR